MKYVKMKYVKMKYVKMDTKLPSLLGELIYKSN